MSNIYIQEPPTSGKVLLQTTVGDIDIELWSRECPKTCLNFVQLCMEGFYKELPFYQIVPNSYAISGDPSCTGDGGESVYGKPFKDELHSRLRFVRRGLVAMLNRGEPNSNTSQFLITLAATPELERKNTLFGKVTGETLFNALRLGEGDVDANGRPKVMQRILNCIVLTNPFEGQFVCRPLELVRPDLVARERERAERERPREAQSRAVQNRALLSFGEQLDEDADEDESAPVVVEKRKPKMLSSHDVLDDPKLSKQTADDAASESTPAQSDTERVVRKLKEAAETHAKSERRADATEPSRSASRSLNDERLEAERKRKAEIRQLQKELTSRPARETQQNSPPPEDASRQQRAIDDLFDAGTPRSSVNVVKRADLKRNKNREEQTLALLDQFSAKLRASLKSGNKNDDDADNDDDGPQDTQASGDGNDNDNDNEDEETSVYAHRLEFVDEESRTRKVLDPHSVGEERYDIYDPRNPLNKRRRIAAKQQRNDRSAPSQKDAEVE